MLGELSGFLINSHNILDIPRLQPKTFVNVGGLQIKRVLDTLPEVKDDDSIHIDGFSKGTIISKTK